MSLTSSTHSLPTHREKASNPDLPFQRQPSYITLSRTLTRLSNHLLPLAPSSNNPPSNLPPDQQLALRDLLSPLPHHRTRTLHTIEHARTLLLQLEQAAQHIKIQRVKRDVVRDLAEKRKLVRRLRGVVEELGREAERREREGEGVAVDAGDDYGGGETVEQLLGLPPLEEGLDVRHTRNESGVRISSTPTAAEEQEGASSSLSTTSNTQPNPTPQQQQQQQNEEPPQLRHRRPQSTKHPPSPTTTTTPNPPQINTQTEKTLLHTDRLTQTTLTTSLLTLAQQLRSQSESLHTTLQTSDKSYLDRALAGLDANLSGMEAASTKMGLLRRMSEAEGWWGRILLYLWIWGLWVVAVLLVFVGPKFRF